MSRHYLILAIGVVFLSTAVVFVKLSHLPSGVIASIRLLLASLVMLPLMLWEIRRNARPFELNDLKLALPAAFLLSVHFISWFIGVRMTTSANATLIVNLSPVVMPFVLLAFVGERINRKEIIGSVISVAGVLILTLGAAGFSWSGLQGDVICIASMITATMYMTLARRNAKGRGIFGYLVPMYAIAGMMCLVYALAMGEVRQTIDAINGQPLPDGTTLDLSRELILMVGVTLLPTVIGHSILNYSMVHLRGQTVAIANLFQVVSAALLAIPLLNEYPRVSFYYAFPLICVGAMIVIVNVPKRIAPAVDRAGGETG